MSCLSFLIHSCPHPHSTFTQPNIEQTTQSSGFGVKGSVGRCYPIWSAFEKCLVRGPNYPPIHSPTHPITPPFLHTQGDGGPLQGVHGLSRRLRRVPAPPQGGTLSLSRAPPLSLLSCAHVLIYPLTHPTRTTVRAGTGHREGAGPCRQRGKPPGGRAWRRALEKEIGSGFI